MGGAFQEKRESLTSEMWVRRLRVACRSKAVSVMEGRGREPKRVHHSSLQSRSIFHPGGWWSNRGMGERGWRVEGLHDRSPLRDQRRWSTLPGRRGFLGMLH
jgi:hypothetical protein